MGPVIVWDRVGACPERSRRDPVRRPGGPQALRGIRSSQAVLRTARPGQRPGPAQSRSGSNRCN